MALREPHSVLSDGMSGFFGLSFRGAKRRRIWGGVGPGIMRFLPAVGMTVGGVGMTSEGRDERLYGA